jgi:rhamnosyl/mannosyltransferase
MSDIDASLFIVGTGPEERKLRTLIEELGLKNKVSIISPQKRLEPFLLAADIFVFPSTERSEAFGLVQLEAMAAGKPVINTYLKTAVEEVSLGGVTGLTVECKNPKALSSAINILVNNESIRKEYGKNAQERYRKLFTLKVFLKNFKEVIFN